MRVTTLDYHTAGEPLRIVTGGLPDIPGGSMLAKRRYMKSELDRYRRFLMLEPRGHADMYGCVVLPPVTPEADIAVLFMHNDGYSTMCGHGIIGVTTVLLECGLLEAAGSVVSIGIDTPAGFVRADAHMVSEGGMIILEHFKISIKVRFYPPYSA